MRPSDLMGLTALLLIATLPCTAQQVFTDVLEAVGIHGQTGFGHAVAWCDIDEDGDPDLAFSNQDGSGFWLYSNDDGVFSDITARAGLGGLGASRILCAELTGDDFTDLVLSRIDSSVYQNNGDGTFTPVPAPYLSGRARGVADFDNDGAADILTWAEDTLHVHGGVGGGAFAPPVDVGAVPDCWTSLCFDADLDGLVDIYVGTYGSRANQLFRNRGNLVFTEEAEEAGVAWTGRTHGLDAGDYDNDGWPDLYLGAFSDPGCVLYRNLGDGSFAEVTDEAGVRGNNDTRTVSFADFDNDGLLDIFVSHHDFYTYSNSMWHNNGDGTFTDLGKSLGLSGEWVGDYFGVGWADFNADQALDLFAAGHVDEYRLYSNDGCPGSALIVELEGRRSNRSAIGASARLHACGSVLTRWVVAGSGQQDFHDPALHFGLGDCPEADVLTVTWPSGIVQRLGPIAAGQRLTVVERNRPLAPPNHDH